MAGLYVHNCHNWAVIFTSKRMLCQSRREKFAYFMFNISFSRCINSLPCDTVHLIISKSGEKRVFVDRNESMTGINELESYIRLGW